ncbi:hypothetical protein GVAV_002275 [Gurleya vavrai]
MQDLEMKTIGSILLKIGLLKSDFTGFFKLKDRSFLPRELRARIKKGMAGGRILNAIIAKNPDRNGITDKALKSRKNNVSFRKSGFFLDTHPAYLNTEFKKAIPSLTKCCKNLALDLYTKTTLEHMVKICRPLRPKFMKRNLKSLYLYKCLFSLACV